MTDNHERLKTKLNTILKELAGTKKNAKPSQKLKELIYDFLTDMDSQVDVGWKTAILRDSRVRITDILEERRSNVAEKEITDEVESLTIELKSIIGWIVPTPPDPETVAAVIARDRGAYEEAKQRGEV